MTVTKLLQVIEQIAEELVARRETVTVAESCTGGMVASSLVAVPGSSDWFHESFVTYSNAAKARTLKVDKGVLERYGAVSEQVVSQMAKGAAAAATADYAMATSGIAGPGGGSQDKPVGMVWFAVYLKGEIITACEVFKGDRESVRQQATLTVINLLATQLKRKTL